MLVRLLIVQKFIENHRLARPQSRGYVYASDSLHSREYAECQIALLWEVL
jgi:hypothetical protein